MEGNSILTEYILLLFGTCEQVSISRLGKAKKYKEKEKDEQKKKKKNIKSHLAAMLTLVLCQAVTMLEKYCLLSIEHDQKYHLPSLNYEPNDVGSQKTGLENPCQMGRHNRWNSMGYSLAFAHSRGGRIPWHENNLHSPVDLQDHHDYFDRIGKARGK